RGRGRGGISGVIRGLIASVAAKAPIDRQTACAEHRSFTPSFRAKGKRSNEYGEAEEDRLDREVTARKGRARTDRRLVDRLQLLVGRDDLPTGQPVAREAAEAGAREAALTRSLGREPGPVVRLGALEPRDKARRPRRHLHRGPGSRCAWRDRADVPRRHVCGDLTGQE